MYPTSLLNFFSSIAHFVVKSSVNELDKLEFVPVRKRFLCTPQPDDLTLGYNNPDAVQKIVRRYVL